MYTYNSKIHKCIHHLDHHSHTLVHALHIPAINPRVEQTVHQTLKVIIPLVFLWMLLRLSLCVLRHVLVFVRERKKMLLDTQPRNVKALELHFCNDIVGLCAANGYDFGMSVGSGGFAGFSSVVMAGS